MNILIKYKFIVSFSVALLGSTFANAQEKGIHFDKDLSWTEIQAKAKAENKYIFVDCFATWCAPCKYMDQHVYNNDSVGNFVNDNFLAVKVQFDTLLTDNEYIRSWRPTAAYLQRTYAIGGFPTYLFFSPAGNVVNEDNGRRSSGNFLALLKGSMDPSKQNFRLFDAYQQGKRDYHKMPDLINWLKRIDRTAQMKAMYEDYITNYFLKADHDEQFNKDNLRFVISFTTLIDPGSPLFSFLLRNKLKIDSAVTPQFAEKSIDYLIIKNLIEPKLIKKDDKMINPDWQKMSHAISIICGPETTDRAIVKAKINWYRSKKDWNNYVKYLIKDASKKYYAPNDLLYLNNNAWEVYQHSNKIPDLQKALSWTDDALKIYKDTLAFVLDTKACLLFKLGKKREGLMLERKAALKDTANIDIKKDLRQMEVSYKKIQNHK